MSYPKELPVSAVIEIQETMAARPERWVRLNRLGFTPERWTCISLVNMPPLDWPNLMFRCSGQYAELHPRPEARAKGAAT